MPRTFQGRLTVAFVAVIALTLVLVSVLVLNRLDDYFTEPADADLEVRAEHGQRVRPIAAAEPRPRATRSSASTTQVNPASSRRPWPTRSVQHVIADQLGQADVVDPSSASCVRDRRELDLRARPGRHLPSHRSGTARARPDARSRPPSPPYTFSGGTGSASRTRCEVDAGRTRTRSGRPPSPTSPACWPRSRCSRSGSSVVVSAALARRFTTPAAPADRAVARPRRGRPRPARADAARSGRARRSSPSWPSSSTRWPTALEESVEIIRRDRDREPRLPGRRLARAAHAAGGAAHVQRAAQGGGRRRPRRPGRVPRVERPADRAPRLAGPEPARAVEARFRAGAARPAPGRPARGRRVRGGADDGGRARSAASTSSSTCPTARSASATTRSGSARSSPTSSATRSSSRRAAGRSRVDVAATADGRADRWSPTRASASTRRAAPHLRALLPRVAGERGARQRQRARSGDRPIDRRHARRHGRRREPARDGSPVHRRTCRATRGSSPARRPPNGPRSRPADAHARRSRAQRDGNFTVRPPQVNPESAP